MEKRVNYYQSCKLQEEIVKKTKTQKNDIKLIN